MRKVSKEAASALLGYRKYNNGNTKVKLYPKYSEMTLFGNAIARFYLEGNELYIRTAGWPTITTKDRLNAFCIISVWTEDYQMYLNGQPWDDHEHWTHWKYGKGEDIEP